MTTVYRSIDIEQCRNKDRTHLLDPITFEMRGISEEEKNWTAIEVDVHSILEINRWLLKYNITEWCWKDRAAGDMRHRYTIYFKHESDLLWFKLGFL